MSAAVSAARVPVRMSVQEFLDWAVVTGGRWELVDGEPRALTPPLRIHGALAGELARLIGNRLEQLGGSAPVVLDAGIVPPLLSDHNMRVADLAVTYSDDVADERAVADPVLIAEILSPSNRAETWSNVWAYTAIPSVQEILVLHGDAIRAQLLRRGSDGNWTQLPEILADGELVLSSVDFRVSLAALYRTTYLARG